MAVSPRMQGWLQSPSPPAGPDTRFASQCPHCVTWTFGDTQQEADQRMASHRRHYHTDRAASAE